MVDSVVVDLKGAMSSEWGEVAQVKHLYSQICTALLYCPMSRCQESIKISTHHSIKDWHSPHRCRELVMFVSEHETPVIHSRPTTPTLSYAFLSGGWRRGKMLRRTSTGWCFDLLNVMRSCAWTLSGKHCICSSLHPFLTFKDFLLTTSFYSSLYWLQSQTVSFKMNVPPCT